MAKIFGYGTIIDFFEKSSLSLNIFSTEKIAL